MIQTDYPIEALRELLAKECLMERYHPLVAYKDRLPAGLKALGCRTKNDAARLSEEALSDIGLTDAGLRRLFRRFLALYDPNPQKFKEIASICSDPAEQAAYTELYHLPGVKAIRAALYYRAGYTTLQAVADATAEEILAKTARTIAETGMTCIPPLPKEARTHVAVARAFTQRQN